MKKSLGQHFLFDPNILRKIVRCSNVGPDDTVVEIGPGLGTMTKILADHAKTVIAVEIDRNLISRLKDNLSMKKNVQIINADALKFPYNEIQGPFRVVANIPYYITTPLIFRLLEFRTKIPGMTLLMQKEVAKRITASPGTRDYGVLTLSLQLCTNPALKFTVSRKAFSPPPDVDSAVVHFEVSPRPLYNVLDEALFLHMVKTAFSQRRKRISNSLKELPGIKEALFGEGIDPGLRPETLSMQDYVRLSNALVKKK